MRQDARPSSRRGPKSATLPRSRRAIASSCASQKVLRRKWVKPGTGVTGVQAETSMVRAAPGEQPGATIGEQIKTTVKVYEVDPYANTIEVTGPRGYNRRLKVKDPKGIAFIRGLKKGDEVEVTFSEALAISVEPAK